MEVNHGTKRTIFPASAGRWKKRPDGFQLSQEIPVADHVGAFTEICKKLVDPEVGVLKDLSEINAVGHRFAHGGKIKQSCILEDEEMNYIESIIPINPLHGPPAISGFKGCKAVMPNVPHVGVFDTSYYSSMEEKAYIYPIPYELYEKYKKMYTLAKELR